VTLPSPVFALFAALALVCLAPLGWTLWRARSLRGRRDAALALHREQLAELDRELAEGRIGAVEHEGATLEVKRRLLAAADSVDAAPSGRGRLLLLAALVLVPLSAEGLYMIDGHPELPDSVAVAADPQADQDADKLIDTLRQRLATMNPKDEMTAQGYLLLGNAEANRGRMQPAIAAWKKVLAVHFDPTLAAQTAESEFQLEGRLSEESRALFQKALDNAPPDAAWLGLVRERLK